MKYPTIWRPFPSCVDPQLLDKHQEDKNKGGKPDKEAPCPAVKGVSQSVVCGYRKGPLALHLKVVQVHPWEVLNHLVSVRHDRGLPYTNFALLCENLQRRKDITRLANFFLLRFVMVTPRYTYGCKLVKIDIT